MLIIKIGIKLGMMKTMYLIRIEMKAKLQVDEYTRLEEEKTLIENGTVFFVNQLNFWGETTLGWTVEIRNFTQLRQKILR